MLVILFMVYIKVLWAAHIVCVWCWMEGLMHGKVRGVSWGISPRLRAGSDEPQRPWVKLACLQAEIRSRELSNTKQERYLLYHNVCFVVSSWSWFPVVRFLCIYIYKHPEMVCVMAL
jgi:hypothetical protein